MWCSSSKDWARPDVSTWAWVIMLLHPESLSSFPIIWCILSSMWRAPIMRTSLSSPRMSGNAHCSCLAIAYRGWSALLLLGLLPCTLQIWILGTSNPEKVLLLVILSLFVGEICQNVYFDGSHLETSNRATHCQCYCHSHIRIGFFGAKKTQKSGLVCYSMTICWPEM